jgi:putative nucleotidyltransferase with HDIG domain
MAGRGTAARAVARAPLAASFEALDHYPALSESRDRLLSLLERGSRKQLVELVRSDVGLTIALLRWANREAGPAGGSVASVAEAAEVSSRRELEELARGLPVFGFFPRTPFERSEPVEFALHAVAVQQAAARLAAAVEHPQLEELMTAALLHDVGRLAMEHAFPTNGGGRRRPLSPEARLAHERDEFGTDHAQIGAELARRWRLPGRLVEAIRHHHDEDAQGAPALVRLSDLLAHYQQGDPVEPLQVHKAALAVGLGRDALGSLMYDLTYPIQPPQPAREPCPLTTRELDVLRELAAGKVYKQVASALGVSDSTVRNHAHNAYRKLGVADRAQAVVLASEHGWL